MPRRLLPRIPVFVLIVAVVSWLWGRSEGIVVAISIAAAFATDRFVVLPWTRRHEGRPSDS